MRLLLVLVAQEVVDCLDRVECAERNVDEDGVPVAHGSIPESWEFECLEFFAVLALVGYESCLWVDVLGEVELLSLVVLDGADEVNGVEVSAVLEHLHVLLIGCVYLAALKYLEADGVVGVVGEERASAWFANVLHHTAHANWSVELIAEIDGEFGIFEVLKFWIAATEFVAEESDYLFELSVGISAAVEQSEIVEGLLLLADEYAGNEFLVFCCLWLETVWHNVVDILDEDDVGIEVIEIFDEGSVASWAEEYLPVLSSEGCVVGVGGYGICARLLLGE